MAKVYLMCVLLTCMVCWTNGVLNSPCNDGLTDCEAGECCAYDTLITGKSGFRGVCKTSLRLGDECIPEGPALGQCGCSHGMSCLSVEATGASKCFYLPH